MIPNPVRMTPTHRPFIQFDFGRNWDDFSKNALDPEKVRQAQADFRNLLEGIPLETRSFLDIGFGQGLSLLSAASAGARCLGIDINPRCLQVLDMNRKTFFPSITDEHIACLQGSILEPKSIKEIQSHRFSKDGKFDIVYSWGVLHHSGAMLSAIRNSAALVSKPGFLVLAIYQTHWSSPLWKLLKYLFNRSPSFGRRLLISFLYPVIYLAKWLVTGKNPTIKERGMDFYYDVVDWVGGYPYEYARKEEIVAYLNELGFDLFSFHPPSTPTGCMEFVFNRRP